MQTPIRMIAPVEIAAAASKGPRRFTTLANTGDKMRIAGYGDPVVIDLAGLTTRKSVTANLDHNSEKRVGHVDEVENDGSKLLLSGLVSAATEAATEFIKAHDQGYPWQASVEAAPEKVEHYKAGQSFSANGRQFTGPAYVARNSVLSAVAFVPNGADDNTHVSIAAKLHQRRSEVDPQFLSFIEDTMPDTDVETLTASELASIHANYSGRQKPNAADREAIAPLIYAANDPVDAEDRRLSMIERATHGEWTDELEARVQEIKAKAIAGDLNIEGLLGEMRTIRKAKLEKSVPVAHTVFSPSRGDNQGKVLECSLCMGGPVHLSDDQLLKDFGERVCEAAYPMRNIGLQQALMMGAVANSYPAAPGERVTMSNLRTVLQFAFPNAPIRAASFSTMSLPNTFANVANKFLRIGWMSVDQTFLRIAAVKPVDNFKETKTISLTGGFTFKPVGPDGELAHGSVGEESYANKADTYGILFNIDRVSIINDDLGALTAIPQRIGRGGMLKLNDIGWAEFLDNGSFFTSGHHNVSTVHGQLSTVGLAAAEVILAEQTDPDGSPLGVGGAILLVPSALKATGATLMTSEFMTGGSTATPAGNIWHARYRLESSPYLSNSRYTGYSSAAWYLLADPSQMPVIEIAALNGRVEPFVETAQAEFSTLGVSMRGYNDVGVRKQEYRGGIRADGVSA